MYGCMHVRGCNENKVVVNGGMLTARNRVLVRESPIRAVQELALQAPRLVRTPPPPPLPN